MPKPQDVAVDPEILRLTQEIEALRDELGTMGRRLAEAERLADHDVLTPLLNRRAFVREVQRAIALTRRHDTPATVIYFDLDDFKGVNDLHGHTYGDRCLVSVARALRSGLNRPSDMVARYGGEEFIILLPETDLRGTTMVAERVQEALGALHLKNDASPFDRQLTASIGVATAQPQPGGSRRSPQAGVRRRARPLLRRAPPKVTGAPADIR